MQTGENYKYTKTIRVDAIFFENRKKMSARQFSNEKNVTETDFLKATDRRHSLRRNQSLQGKSRDYAVACGPSRLATLLRITFSTEKR